jgi:phosphomevalonate kinase
VTAILTSAPGKLFLLGEYAVLEGAPALLTAVDARVRVRVEPADAPTWRLEAADLGIRGLALGADGTLPTGPDAGTRDSLRVFDAVRAAVAELADRRGGIRPGGILHPALAVSIDSGALRAGGHKLGLGSSAAVAVALTAALARAAGLELDRGAVFVLANAAHRAAQGGAGSGGDVAASTYGGLLRYTKDTPPMPLAWPAGLTMLVVVTGTGSSTTDLVGRVGDYAARDRAGYRADLDRLIALAECAPAAVRSADLFLELASDYFDALCRLDAHAHAGIVTDRHRQLRELAAQHSAVFKTSGAGGGDVGLAFSHSGAPALELAAALAAAGADVVPLGFGTAGLEDGI